MKSSPKPTTRVLETPSPIDDGSGHNNAEAAHVSPGSNIVVSWLLTSSVLLKCCILTKIYLPHSLHPQPLCLLCSLPPLYNILFLFLLHSLSYHFMIMSLCPQVPPRFPVPLALSTFSLSCLCSYFASLVKFIQATCQPILCLSCWSLTCR